MLLLAAPPIIYLIRRPSIPPSTNHPQNEDEYKHVVENHRLPNGLLFGLPVVFDTSREDIKPGQVSHPGIGLCMYMNLPHAHAINLTDPTRYHTQPN